MRHLTASFVAAVCFAGFLGFPGVGVARSTPVTVVNTDAEAVPVVTETERAPRSPFARRISVAFGLFRGIPTSERVAGDAFTVPAESILVIEHVSLRATQTLADQVGFVEIRFHSGGVSATHSLAVRTDLASLPSGSTQKITNYDWPVKIYVDPGSEVILNLNSTVGSSGGSAQYVVSGYLVPASSASLGQ